MAIGFPDMASATQEEKSERFNDMEIFLHEKGQFMYYK